MMMLHNIQNVTIIADVKSRHHLKPFNEYCRVLKSRYQFVNLMTLVDLIVF